MKHFKVSSLVFGLFITINSLVALTASAQPTMISSFSPSSGPVGTLVTIHATYQGMLTSLSIGGTVALVINNNGSGVITGFVMPGAVTGAVSLTASKGGTGTSSSSFTVTPTKFPSAQQGAKLTGNDNTGTAFQGWSVAISADGNTAIVGGTNDNTGQGAAWIYTRSGGTWSQQGSKLVATDNTGAARQGWSVAISADGNTAMVGGPDDNGSAGAAWIYTRSGNTWSQQGSKLVGTGSVGAAQQGTSVSLSADGNTAVIGGIEDNSFQGAAWIYTRSGSTWTQQGKLVGTGSAPGSQQGYSAALSADGNTLIVGGMEDNSLQGAAWVYTRSGNTFTQQGNKLVGTGNVGNANQGWSVALSADGNTAIVGGTGDNSNEGAAWVYTRSAATWNQQDKLVGTGGSSTALQGHSVSLSADGNTAMVGGIADNSNQGASWVFTRSGNTWSQQGNKLVGVGNTGAADQGQSVSLSAGGTTAIVGGYLDNSGIGAAWVYTVGATDATLSNIALSSGSLSPTFSSTQLSYNVTVPNGTTAITITPTTNDPNATATVNGQTPATAVSLAVGATAIPVVVTAQNGVAQITYTVNVTRQNSIVSINTASANPSAGPSVTYSVTFSGPVQALDAGDFSLTATGTAQGSVTGVNFSGNTATVTVTGITGNGTLTLNYATNESYAGVSNTLPFAGQTYTIDNTPPTATAITAASPSNANPTNATSVTYTVTFSEPVTGVDASDFTVTGASGSVTNISGNGTTYTVTVGNISGNGTLGLNLNSSGTGIQDLAGNAISGGFTGGDTYTVQQTPPTVTSITGTTPNPATPTNATSVTYTVTFSEPVTGVVAGDFTVTGASGSVTNVSGSGATYTITVGNISGNGTLGLNLNSSGTGIQDLAGNAISGGFTSGDTYTVQQTPPTATAITAASPSNASPTNATSVTYTVTFSEPVTGVDASDFTVTGVSGSVTNVSGSGATYTITVGNISGNGTLGLNLNSSGTGIQDLAGNAIAGGYTGGDTYTIDQMAPTVVSLSRTDLNPTNETELDWQITFSEPVTNVNAADFFTTATGGLSAGAISIGAISSTVYDISLANISGSGRLQMSLSNGSPITDLAGNVISGGFQGDTYTVNQASPVVTAITALGSSPNNASSDQFSVTFSEAVFGVDVTDFTITNTGSVSGIIGAVTGSGSTYTVTVNSVTGDGTMRLDLNNTGDPITDAATNVLTSAFTAGSVYNIDHTPPAALSITASGANPTNATSVTYIVTFSEPVTGVVAGDFTVAGVSGSVTNVSGNGTTYTVTVGNISGNGTLGLNLNSSGTGIQDLAGNAISGGFTSGDTYTVQQTPPTATGITAASPSNTNPTNATSVTYTVTFSEAVTGVDASDFTVTGVSGSVTNVSGSGATYTITVGNISGNGTLGLNLNSSGTGIQDLAGNAIAGGYTGGDTYTIDQMAPTVVSLSRTDLNPTNETELDWQITFSEPVTNVNAADFFTTATGGLSAGAISIGAISSTVYDISLANISGSGRLQMSLSNGSPITDLAGNVISGGFQGDTYTVNQASPVVTAITALGSSPNNASSDQFSVTFSEAVFGVDVTDFTITNTGSVSGIIGAVTGSGSTYTVTVNSVTGDGTMRLDLNNTGDPITDAATNVLTSAFTAGSVYNIDHTPPAALSITASGANPTNATSVTYIVTFSEPVTGVVAGDFTVAGVSGSVTNVSGNGTTYTVTVGNISGSGTLRLDLNSGTGIQDLAGNAISGGFTGGDVYTINNIPPTVSSITAASPSNANPTNATSVTYTVTFSEPVTGVVAGDFTVTGVVGGYFTVTGVSGSVTNVSGSGATYTVTVGNISGNGTLRLNLNSSGTGIQDLAGNAILGGFTSGDTYTIQQTPPTATAITATSPSNANPTNATSVTYTVTFSEPVTGVVAGDFTVTTSGTAGSVTNVTGSGAAYVVTVGSITGNGSLRLDLNSGGTGIMDAATNPISGGYTNGDVYAIDNIAPTIAIGAPSVATTISGPVTYAVTYSDVNFNTSTLSRANIILNSTGTAAGSISVDNGTGTSRTVTISGITGAGTLGISIAAGTASDLAGNLAPAAGASATFNVVTPTISITGTPSALSTTSGTASSSTSFALSGSNLTPGNLTVIAPQGFDVGPDNSTWSSSGGNYTIPETGALLSTPVYIRLDAGDAPNTYSGNITISGGGATTVNVTLPSGTVSTPLAAITGITPGSVNSNAGTIQFTVTFGASITGLSANNFSLTTTGTISGASVSSVSSGTNSYTVTVNTGTGYGTIGLNLANAASLTPGISTTLPFTGGTTTIDKTPPTITVSSPSVSSITDGAGTVTYSVTYADANFNTSTLTLGNITLNTTGSAGGTLGLTKNSSTSYTVTISGITGAGALGISIAAGTASDLAGNLAPASGASATFNVSSSDASLGSLTVSSVSLSPAFNSGILTYTASVVNSTTSVTVTPTTNFPGATVTVNGGSAANPVNLVVGPNTITVLVTAQNGVTKETYTITVTRAGSSNALLSSLRLNTCSLSPVFSRTIYSYTSSVSNSMTSITVTPTTADATATIKVNGVTVISGATSTAIPLSVGSNTITIVVTARDGLTTKTYTIVVTRAASTNAYLASLKVNNGTTAIAISPTFSQTTTAYTATVAYATTSVTITPTAADATATIKVNGTTVASGTASGSIALTVGSNVITTVVTAQNGTTIETYKVTITRAAASTNAYLSNLKVNSGTTAVALSPTFAQTTTAYTASVAYATTSVTITPTTADATATIKVNGVAVASGTASGSITLTVGSNIITTVVTAQNGTTIETYKVTVTRSAASTNAYLSSLKLDCGETGIAISPKFSQTTLKYTASVANSTSSITVTPTTADATATVKVNGNAISSGSPSSAIPLVVGTNIITTVVTAQNGTATETYTITVTRNVSGSDKSVYEPISVSPPESVPVLADDGIYVHRGVSPNGDGIDDYLQIDNIINYPDNRLMVMNRNGMLVYETKGYDNSSRIFDGHSNKTGQMQLPGTYFYSLDYVVNGITKHKTGFLILKY